MSEEGPEPFYEPVSLTITSGTLLLGDKPEVLAGCEKTSGRIAMKKGTYRVLYKPALLVIIKDTCTRDEADDFMRTLNPPEDGYIDPSGPIQAKGLGRMGHCMSGYLDDEDDDDWDWYQDGIYVACDEQTDHDAVRSAVSKEAISKSRKEEQVISFADGRGISVSTGSEYKYLVTAGKQMVASLGYEMCDSVEELISELDKVWPRHVTKAAN